MMPKRVTWFVVGAAAGAPARLRQAQGAAGGRAAAAGQHGEGAAGAGRGARPH